MLWILRTGAQWRASGHHFINYARDVASQLESELRGVEAGPSEPISDGVGSLVKTLGQTVDAAGFVGSRVTNDGAVFGFLRPFDNFLPAEVHAEPSAKLPFGVSKVATKRMLGAK